MERTLEGIVGEARIGDDQAPMVERADPRVCRRMARSARAAATRRTRSAEYWERQDARARGASSVCHAYALWAARDREAASWWSALAAALAAKVG